MTDQTTEAEATPSTEVTVQETPSEYNRVLPRVPKPPLLANGGRPLAIIPRSFDDAWRIAKMAVAAGWAPKGWKEENAAAAIMHGAEVGLPPMMAMQKICVINGRPSLWGDAVPAIAMATGQLEDWYEHISDEGTDDMFAVCTVKRRGVKTLTVRTFSVRDAKAAGLWDERPRVRRKSKDGGTYETDNDSPWHCYPKRMLLMRARVAFRDAFADAFSGLYIAEELQGEPEMRDVTPAFRPIDNPLGPDPIERSPEADSIRRDAAKMLGLDLAGATPATGANPKEALDYFVERNPHLAQEKPAHAPEAAPATQAAPTPENAPVRPGRATGGK